MTAAAQTTLSLTKAHSVRIPADCCEKIPHALWSLAAKSRVMPEITTVLQVQNLGSYIPSKSFSALLHGARLGPSGGRVYFSSSTYYTMMSVHAPVHVKSYPVGTIRHSLDPGPGSREESGCRQQCMIGGEVICVWVQVSAF